MLLPETLTHIARWMSMRPRNAYWSSYISAYDALALLSVGEPLTELRGLLLGSLEWDQRVFGKYCSLVERMRQKGTLVVDGPESDLFWRL